MGRIGHRVLPIEPVQGNHFHLDFDFRTYNFRSTPKTTEKVSLTDLMSQFLFDLIGTEQNGVAKNCDLFFVFWELYFWNCDNSARLPITIQYLGLKLGL